MSDDVFRGGVFVRHQAFSDLVFDEDRVLGLHLHVPSQLLHRLLQFLDLPVGCCFPLDLLNHLEVFVGLAESADFCGVVQKVGEEDLLGLVEVEARVVSGRERLHSKFLFVALHLNLKSTKLPPLSLSALLIQ